MSTYTQLREALVEKYGRPTAATTTSESIRTQSSEWVLKHTVIRLTWYDGGRDIGIVSVRYSERRPSDSL
jgi:hypothetical protein